MTTARIRRLWRTTRSLVDPRQVGYLIVYVTNRCNFRCSFCFYGEEIVKGRKPDELTLAEHQRIARQTGPLIQLSIGGGEPFLRRDVDAIVSAYVRETGVTYVTIVTNGWYTERTEAFVHDVVGARPDTTFRICLSIEALGEEHDVLRSKTGSFARIRTTHDRIGPLRRRFGNLILDANSVFTARTEHTLLDTLRGIDEAFDFDNLGVTYARGKMPDPSLKQVSNERYVEIVAYLESRQRLREGRRFSPVVRGIVDLSREHLIRTVISDEFVSPCVAGSKLAVITETGDVRPCEILPHRFGNLRDNDYDLHAVLRAAEARQTCKWIVESKCRCSFECALTANVVWNPRHYPALAAATARNVVRTWGRASRVERSEGAGVAARPRTPPRG
jgi:MoaA/NifB/PqqE/SkfB family radical SAM enzyme